MRRRVFVAGLVMVVKPTALSVFEAQAQRRGKVPKIGFLGPTTPEIASRWIESFVKRLAELERDEVSLIRLGIFKSGRL
jgi:hypothetical protein